nr:MAG TPA: hypothetical protein [Caudoviricetes sp.]
MLFSFRWNAVPAYVCWAAFFLWAFLFVRVFLSSCR